MYDVWDIIQVDFLPQFEVRNLILVRADGFEQFFSERAMDLHPERGMILFQCLTHTLEDLYFERFHVDLDEIRFWDDLFFHELIDCHDIHCKFFGIVLELILPPFIQAASRSEIGGDRHLEFSGFIRDRHHQRLRGSESIQVEIMVEFGEIHGIRLECDDFSAGSRSAGEERRVQSHVRPDVENGLSREIFRTQETVFGRLFPARDESETESAFVSFCDAMLDREFDSPQ